MKMNSAGKKTIAPKNVVRKSLHDLQSSAEDKENLVGAGRILKSDRRSMKVKAKSNMSKKKSDISICKKTYKNKFIQTIQEEKVKIEAEDLTSKVGPSENYWEVIAERRHLALRNVIEENKKLSERNEILEKELNIYKEMLEKELNIYQEMLDETGALAEVLQDMIRDDRNSSNNSLENSTL